ncbi:MAG: hypothetical protein C0623_11465 [Desulfuromonas sp.]|nr:MAG: hypothetical protein C0623_11465 [Desulfuromonas sp.]
MKFSLRRLIVTITLVLIIAATTIVSIFISEFDLNNFRAQISDSISTQLSQPANLGKAHFSIKHGPSFAFDDILIGTKQGPLYLTAEHIFFRLDVLPLLRGDFRFSEILFEKPDITLKVGQKLTGNSNKATGIPDLEQTLWTDTLVRSIRIHDGHFRIEDYSRSETPFVVALEQLRMVVDDLSLQESGKVEITADINCNDIRSPLKLSGNIRAGESKPFWNHATFDLDMNINDFASDVLSNRYQHLSSRFRIEGRTDITTRFSGSPAEGLNFNIALSGRDLGIRLPGRNEVISAKQIGIEGNWQKTDQLHKFAGIDLLFDSTHFYGDGQIDLAQKDPVLTTEISAPHLPLTMLNHFLPADSALQARSGTVRLNRLDINAKLSTLMNGVGRANAVQNLEIELLQGELILGRTIVTDINFDLGWKNQKISLKHLHFNSGDIQVSSDAGFDIASPGAALEKLNLTGQWNMTLQNRIRAKDSHAVFPEKGLKAVLHLDAVYSGNTWNLKDNLLALPSIKIIFQGHYETTGDREYSLRATMPEFSLSDLFLISPAISAIQPGGKMSGDIEWTGSTASPSDLSGKIILNEASLQIAGPIADLTRLNGKIRLDWPEIRGEGLSAQLGQSPIQLGLEIPDLNTAKVNMIIRGDSIRADELIFRSDKAYLRDVDSRLSITENAIYLGPIYLRMDRGTNVTINGTVSNLPAANTKLTIEGRYGNIDEVISLWLADNPQQFKQKQRKQQGSLEIDIHTAAGEIANLPFEESTGHISYRDRTLIINPIEFKSGPGTGIGQVLVKYRDNQPPLMKISGHLENFDALAVYQQLLQRKGIITGRLWGDFYLEGTAGNLKEVFLPSSFGAFDFTVRDGVLKKLRGLSNALTLFNVYPIFTSSGKERGVPFDKLQGNTILKNGILASENISMQGDVMNMTMTGTQDLIANEVDLELGIMPLRTIDRLLTKITLAGWILTGEKKALVTAHFKLSGPGDDPNVTPIPIESASKQVIGLFRRLFTLPVKIISDVNEAIN